MTAPKIHICHFKPNSFDNYVFYSIWASFIFLLTLSECILYFQATSFIYFGGLDRRSIQIIMIDFPL
jgi:hypothetical protein